MDFSFHLQTLLSFIKFSFEQFEWREIMMTIFNDGLIKKRELIDQVLFIFIKVCMNKEIQTREVFDLKKVCINIRREGVCMLDYH